MRDSSSEPHRVSSRRALSQVEQFTAAIEADPTNHILYSNRSGAHAAMGAFTPALLDANKCIDILIKDHDMSELEAIEYFEFNVSGAYVGENTPIWLYPYEDL